MTDAEKLSTLTTTLPVFTNISKTQTADYVPTDLSNVAGGLYTRVQVVGLAPPTESTTLPDPSPPTPDVGTTILDAASPLNTAHFRVDTGSFATVLPLSMVTDVIKDFDQSQYQAGSLEYSSDHRVENGIWVPLILAFPDARLPDGSVPTTTVTALVRTDGNAYMLGVGYGDVRATNVTGHTITPLDNAFLNLSQMSSGGMAHSYAIGRDGITLGFTAENMSHGWTVQKLLPTTQALPQNSPSDWQLAQVQASLDGVEHGQFNLLLDTGLNDMFFEFNGGSKVDETAGHTVTLGLAGALGNTATYRFETGGDSSQAPTSVHFENPLLGNGFVNTGANALTGFDYFYDADRGLVGLRPNDAGTNTSITTAAPTVAGELAAFAMAVAQAVHTPEGKTYYTYNVDGSGQTAQPLIDLSNLGKPVVLTDCSGWMNYSLNSVSPIHAAIISSERLSDRFNPTSSVYAYNPTDPAKPIEVSISGSAARWPQADVYSYFFQSQANGLNGFANVPDITKLRPGDMLAWSLGIYTDPLNPDAKNTPGLSLPKDTGHVVTVVGGPVLVQDTTLTSDPSLATNTVVAVYAVPIVDASDVPHMRAAAKPPLADNRDYNKADFNELGAHIGGLGTGTIYIAVNSSGEAVQFRFAQEDPYFPSATSGQYATIAAARPVDTVNLSGLMLKDDNHLTVDVLPNASPVFFGVSYDIAAVDLTGAGGITLRGGGTLTLGGESTYSGGTTLTAGRLILTRDTGAGTGSIDFDGQATLEISKGVTIANTVNGFAKGDLLVFDGITATALALGPDNVLHVRAADGAVTSLQLDATLGHSGLTLSSAVDAAGATTISVTQRPATADGVLVDSLSYLGANPDVFRHGVDAKNHYDTFGWHEGRNPDAVFTTNAYLEANADIRLAGVNPLDHYNNYGWHEGRDPSASFDTTLYLARNLDVATSGMNPLVHYLAYGQSEGRKAVPVADGAHLQSGFDSTFYKLANPDVSASGLNPFTHWQQYGMAEHRNPNAFFDTGYYLAHNPDVATAGVDPLQHYMQYGWKEARDPSSHFSTSAYLNNYADVKAADVDPLIHFLQFGLVEGRSGFGDLV